MAHYVDEGEREYYREEVKRAQAREYSCLGCGDPKMEYDLRGGYCRECDEAEERREQ